MSVKVMSYVWDIPVFKGSDKLIMLCLADFADDMGLCWPSIDTISRKSGVSATTVKSAIKKLVEGGWLSKRSQSRVLEGGKRVRTNNQYQLHVVKLKKIADESAESARTEIVQTKPVQTDSACTESEQTELDQTKSEQTKNTRGVGQNPTGGGSKSDHDPSIDPPIDPSSNNLAPSKPLDVAPVLFEIPLNRKGESHPITQSDIQRYQEDFPAVNIREQIRRMIAWCDANPRRKKTSQGVKQFINAWLGKAQDKGRYLPPEQQQKPKPDELTQLKTQLRQLEMNIKGEGDHLVRIIERGGTEQAQQASKKTMAEYGQQRQKLIERIHQLEVTYG